MGRLSTRLAATAVLLALVVLVAALVLALRDGVASDALIFGVPPIVVASAGYIALYAGTRYRQTGLLITGLVMEGLALAAATVSFITPLLAAVAPVSGLLIAATVMELTAHRAET